MNNSILRKKENCPLTFKYHKLMFHICLDNFTLTPTKIPYLLIRSMPNIFATNLFYYIILIKMFIKTKSRHTFMSDNNYNYLPKTKKFGCVGGET